MGEEKIFELQNIISDLDYEGGYLLDFMKVRNLEAGIIRLHPGEKDIQKPHSADELYYVLEGSGFMEIGKTSHLVKKGSIIFVPAGLEHRFYGNKDDLTVLYVFAEE
jgi:mannose-6-phosphate isomerase-like protein (cupin superfamily)